MDLETIAELIEEELEGSMRYVKTAIELKPMTEAWSKKFLDMSVEEHKHANNLYLLFNEYCSKIAGSFVDVPTYVSEVRSKTIDCYADCTAKIKAMWDIYKQ